MYQRKKEDTSVGIIYVNKPTKNKEGKEVQGYLNITIDLARLGVGTGEVKLMAFRNTYKTEDKHPDFRILPNTRSKTSVISKTAAAAPKNATNVASDDDSGLPF